MHIHTHYTHTHYTHILTVVSPPTEFRVTAVDSEGVEQSVLEWTPAADDESSETIAEGLITLPGDGKNYTFIDPIYTKKLILHMQLSASLVCMNCVHASLKVSACKHVGVCMHYPKCVHALP